MVTLLMAAVIGLRPLAGDNTAQVAEAAGPVVYVHEDGFSEPIPYYAVANRGTNAAFRVWSVEPGGDKTPAGEIRWGADEGPSRKK